MKKKVFEYVLALIESTFPKNNKADENFTPLFASMGITPNTSSMQPIQKSFGLKFDDPVKLASQNSKPKNVKDLLQKKKIQNNPSPEKHVIEVKNSESLKDKEIDMQKLESKKLQMNEMKPGSGDAWVIAILKDFQLKRSKELLQNYNNSSLIDQMENDDCDLNHYKNGEVIHNFSIPTSGFGQNECFQNLNVKQCKENEFLEYLKCPPPKNIYHFKILNENDFDMLGKMCPVTWTPACAT